MHKNVIGGVIIVNFFFAGASSAMVSQDSPKLESDPQATAMIDDTQIESLTRAERRALRKAERQAKREARRDARRAKRAKLAQNGRGQFRSNRYRSLDPYYPYGLGFRSGFRNRYYGGVSRFGFRGSRLSRFRYYNGFGFRGGFGW